MARRVAPLAPWAALVASLAAGCGANTEHRAAWLQATLTDDNRDLLYRSPDLVAGKYAKMALGPYPYMRGTALQWMRDLTQPGPVPMPARPMAPAAARVLLMGDPHPENLGSFLPADGDITVEFNDFDAARYGPYVADLWRLGSAFELLGRVLELDDAVQAELRAAAAEGYFDTVAALAAGEPAPRAAFRAGAGAIADDLMRRGLRDGQVREELLDYTEVVDGARRFKIGDLEASPAPGVVGEALAPISDRERRLITRLMEDYRTTVLPAPELTQDSLQLKDVVRQVGSGVSSYPLLRYYLLLEGPTASVEDDWLVEAKEIRDPAPIPGLPLPAPRVFRTNAERVVAAQRALQATDRDDPLLGHAADGAFSLKLRHRTKYQKGADVARMAEDLAAGDLVPADVVAFARLAGTLLGRGHALAPTLDGPPGGPALRESLGDDRAAFVAQAADVAERYADQLFIDHQLFVELLATHGPFLGARLEATP
ncbi:MAG: DUF2252 family protein [Deltaproteobacteria bacterium]|nr:DUF2252 family protein [Deltaproteobacteria bacterium]